MSNTRLIAMPKMLIEDGRIDRYVLSGRTVAQHLADIGWNPSILNARVTIDGLLVEQAQWQFVCPRDGQVIIVRRLYSGGRGGGGGGKQAMTIVAMLGVVALALAAPQLAYLGFAALGEAGAMGASALFLNGSGWGLALSAGVGIAGMLAVNALVPPALPSRKALTNEKSVSVSTSTGRRHHPRRIPRRAASSGRAARKSYRQKLAA